MYKAVIFDLDGTLLDTLTDLANAVNFSLREGGLPERTADEVRSFVGNGVELLMRRAVPDGTTEDVWAERLECFSLYYTEHMLDNTVPYPGALLCLEHLKSAGVRCAVVSNKLHAAVSELCRRELGLEDAFGVENESERKPSPRNVLKALEALGVEKEDAVYVGDSDVDLQTAKNSGLRCISASWGFRSREELKTAGAETIVDSFEELEKQLLSNLKQYV